MSRFNIYERCEDFSVQIILLTESIPYRRSIGIIFNQLIRSATSVGANLCEADNGRSTKEFSSFLGISLREFNEAIYWLKVLRRINKDIHDKIELCEKEAIEIKKILGSIYNKTRARH